MADNENRLQSFYKRCREHGLRITPQRTAIYEMLTDSDNHPSAEHIYEQIKKRFPNISFDTVNRTLIKFTDIGLANIVESYGGARRYDPNLDHHHHIHCVKCREIFDFENENYDDLEIPPEIRKNYKILNKRVVINAVCKRCRRRTSLKKKSRKKE